jgi:hypothetical protein
MLTLVLLALAVAGAVFLLTDGRALLGREVGPQREQDLSPGDGVLIYPLR